MLTVAMPCKLRSTTSGGVALLHSRLATYLASSWAKPMEVLVLPDPMAPVYNTPSGAFSA